MKRIIAFLLCAHLALAGAGKIEVKDTKGNVTWVSPSGGISAITDTGAFTLSGAGTVTSVDMSVPAFLSIAGNPVTTTGTLALTLSGTALPAANGGTGLTALSANVVTLLGAANYAAFKTSLSLGNVENTALSTWGGSSNLATTGTLTGGATGAGFTVAFGSSTFTGSNAVANGGTAGTTIATAHTGLGLQHARLSGDTSNSSSSTHVVIWSFNTVSGNNYHLVGMVSGTGGASGQGLKFCLHGITFTSMKLAVAGETSGLTAISSDPNITAIDTFSGAYCAGSTVTGVVWIDCFIEGASTGTASIDFVTSTNGTSVTVKKNSAAEITQTN